jgi:hypothetical protein
MHFAEGAAFFARGIGLRFREHLPPTITRHVVSAFAMSSRGFEDHEAAEVASMIRMRIIRGAYIFAAVCG